jgi:hypothetical protein
MMNARSVSILVLCLGAAQAGAIEYSNCEDQKSRLHNLEMQLLNAKKDAPKEIRAARIYGTALNHESEHAHRRLVESLRNQFKNAQSANGRITQREQTFAIKGLKDHSGTIEQTVTFTSGRDGKSFMIIKTQGNVLKPREWGGNEYNVDSVAETRLVNVIDLSTGTSPKEGETYMPYSTGSKDYYRAAKRHNGLRPRQYTKDQDVRALFDIDAAKSTLKTEIEELQIDKENQTKITIAACAAKQIEDKIPEPVLSPSPAPDAVVPSNDDVSHPR